MINKGMMTSNTPEWATPQAFFDELDKEFHFNLDPCANTENHKCAMWFNEEEDGLSKSWDNSRVFCNPPYGKVLKNWVKKASEARGGGSRDANSRTNRHPILSRVYLPKAKCGDTLYQRSPEVWRRQRIRSLPVNGSNL